MKPMKYIEIILSEAIVQAFTDMIDTYECEAYTVYSGLTGKSRRGVATAGLNDASVTIICDETQAKALIAGISTFLDRNEGIGCMIQADGFAIGRRHDAR